MKRGDLLEIVVIQSKGGSSRRPTPEDIARSARFRGTTGRRPSFWQRGA
jgi:hypothetical protein